MATRNLGIRIHFMIGLLMVSIVGCKSEQKSTPGNYTTTEQINKPGNDIAYSLEIKVDGQIDERWEEEPWRPIDQVWLGSDLGNEDFNGKFKLLWNEQRLFVLALIQDDRLLDHHDDPKELYWDDDCLEIFVDENASQGIHQYNHNAFAYHISLDQKVLDIGRDSLPHFYNDNLESRMRQVDSTKYLWEVGIKMYGEEFLDDRKNESLDMKADQKIGFAIAYCDNDDSQEREHFIGSSKVEGEDKNRGWIDAGIFDGYILKK